MSPFQEAFRDLRKKIGVLPAFRVCHQTFVELGYLDAAMSVQYAIERLERPPGNVPWNQHVQRTMREAAIFTDQIDRNNRAPGN